jgi:ABC-2 type transport system ATP-binding protein
MPEPAIVTSGLTKRYGDLVAVDHLDLQVRRGEIFGLLGPNGAGKTTTILMLLGLSEPAEGEARVAGLDPTRQPLEVKRRVGYLPDNVGFYPDLTGRQNLRYTAGLNRIPREAAEARIQIVLERVGLSEVVDKAAGAYSRGMRQRLGIADALIKEPEILILDEPTVGIDPEGVQEMLDLIGGLARERQVTVLLSSHLLYQVQAICDRVGIFVDGKLIAHGPVQELANRLGGKRVVLEVGTTAGTEVEEILRNLPAVEAVQREGEIWVLTAERDLRPEVAKVLTEKGFGLWHLRRRGEELDEIYRRYFEGRDGRAR